ncbi:phage virion morphogenesis protein [Vibrio amylolyticus]|uniref:phage virion morphogenesis protein n=1 Tax=Vibrio amylolyticus TaxID=2847292 RepID=UPI00354E71FB
MLQVKADERTFLRAKEQIDLLMLDRKTRTRLYRRLGAQLVKKTKANIRAQRNPDGSPWKRRKRGKGKMFKGLQRKVKHRQFNNNRDLKVGWFGFSSFVASRHHYGKGEKHRFTEKIDKDRRDEKIDKNSPASRVQAKNLRELDFRLKPQGNQRRGKKPTLRWVTENMTIGEAAKEIQKLENRQPKSNWQIDRPERQLIGISPKRMAMMIKKELNRNRSS